MKIAIGADHAGFERKNQLGDVLRQSGHTLGARFTDFASARELLRVFLETPFEDSDNNGGRHARRVSKIAQMEDEL
jgi:ribose 5-phosphate isomerase RpiB